MFCKYKSEWNNENKQNKNIFEPISPQIQINDFPIEILLKIFSYLESDDSSLLAAEQTCPRWKSDLEKGRVYSKKCRKMIQKNPELAPTFAQHKFEELIQSDVSASKRFYFKLRRLSGRWNKKPRVTVIDCLQAEVGGQKMKVSEDWSQRHNYTGSI